MIANYDPNFIVIHIVRATFQAWDYIGHVAFAVGGNCRGAAYLDPTFLETDTQEDIDRYEENDCQFSFNDDTEEYCAVLHREDGDTLEWSGDEDSFKDILVALEIVGCREQPLEKGDDQNGG